MTEITKLEHESSPDTDKLLVISNSYPGTIYISVLDQLDKTNRYGGETIGVCNPGAPGSPVVKIESQVRGGRASTKRENFLGTSEKSDIGEKTPEFDISSTFTLAPNIYVDDGATQKLLVYLRETYGAQVELVPGKGPRHIKIEKEGRLFDLNLGYVGANEEIEYLQGLIHGKDPEHDGMIIGVWQDLINKIAKGNDQRRVSLGVLNSYSELSPAGIPLKSQEDFYAHLSGIKDLTEGVATVLMKEIGNGQTFPQNSMEWKSKSIAPTVWQESAALISIENLRSLSLEELNSSLVRVVQVLEGKKYSPEVVTGEGMNKDAEKLLELIENYFIGRVPADEKDRTLLALGLALKTLKKPQLLEDMFISEGTSTIGGITFRRFGESRRDRCEFYLQQDRKYKYRKDTAEAADFFLLHTTREGDDGLTEYEKIQSDNLEKARAWAERQDRNGNVLTSLADAQEINRLLLLGIVPERNLGDFRKSENTILKGRVGTTRPSEIPHNLTKLLGHVGEIIRTFQGSTYRDKEVLFKELVAEWVKFDAIHPMEEGNGRTGTLLFESWYRAALGEKYKFEASRAENLIMQQAMSSALRGNENLDYIYGDPLDGDISIFLRFVKSHMVLA